MVFVDTICAQMEWGEGVSYSADWTGTKRGQFQSALLGIRGMPQSTKTGTFCAQLLRHAKTHFNTHKTGHNMQLGNVRIACMRHTYDAYIPSHSLCPVLLAAEGPSGGGKSETKSVQLSPVGLEVT